MRALVALLVVVAAAGCAEPPLPTEEPTEQPRLAKTGAEGLGAGLRLALQPGPSSAAVLLDVPIALWEHGLVTPQPGLPSADLGWGLEIQMAVEGLDSWDGTGPTPQVGVLPFRVEGDAAVPVGLWGPNPPLTSDGVVELYDRASCQPMHGRYLFVVLADTALPVNVTLAVGGGGGEDAPWVLPDLAGGPPAIAWYDESLDGPLARSWNVTDSRTRASAPGGAYGAETGLLRTALVAAPGQPGIYAFWHAHGVFGAEAGMWKVAATADTGEPETLDHPLAMAYASISWIHGSGSFKDHVEIVSELDATHPDPDFTQLAAYVAPLDLGRLGLRVEAATSAMTWLEIYPELAKPSLC